jgi:hypothetical protein
MRPDADRFNSGNIAWVTANVPKKLMSKVLRTALRLAAEFCHPSLAPTPIASAEENVMPFLA